MDKYLKRKPRTQDSSYVQDSSSSSKWIHVDFNLENFPLNLGLWEKILSYHPNNHNEIRRYYLQKGPCPPVFQNPDDYPLSYFSGKLRQFRSEWYVNRKLLEYNIDKNAVFCLYCYLFGQGVGKKGGGETFVTKGFKLWNLKEKLNSHLGGVNSAHNQAVKKREDCRVQKSFLLDK